jgi:hypothetical protein
MSGRQEIVPGISRNWRRILCNKFEEMKKTLFVLIVLLAILSMGCEKAVEISGDSSLKIINDCDYSVKIYFDDAYIGWVSSDEEETWSVPSGNHNVKATCSFADDYEDDFNFIAGIVTIIHLELQNKSKQALVFDARPYE